jgi:redox-sensitive bicupin YhaK (pirin superfamily)
MVSSKSGDAPIKINQDANIYSLELSKGKEIAFPVKGDRQAYLVQIEGNSSINHIELTSQDALEIKSEDILIKAIETSHILLIEMHR